MSNTRKSAEISATAAYNSQALRDIGIGDKIIEEMRRDGVKPAQIGNTKWYHGKQVIEYMKRKTSG